VPRDGDVEVSGGRRPPPRNRPLAWGLLPGDSKGHFPNEEAARKLIYLAITNAVPARTRTRNWTTALLAFKIHFGDRLPE
jgi:hypothetical protein